MSGRMYSLHFANVASAAVLDWFEIAPADDKAIAVWGLFLGQNTEVGDAAEEQLAYSIIRGFATSGSGGASIIERPMRPNDGSAFMASEGPNTTQAAAGSPQILHQDVFNVRSGLQLWFPPEARPFCTQAETMIVVRLDTTPGDSITWFGTMYIEEFD